MKKNSKPDAPQYRLLIAPHLNERTQKYTTRVALETSKPFAAFRYELNVKELISGKSIFYKVVGLSAPKLSLPSPGPAAFSTEHETLKGEYTVSIEGLDGKVSSFSVRIGPRLVKVTKPVTGAVIDIVTDERQWPSRSFPHS